jgi:DNA-binding beta-propeller fold protein YncE
MSPYPTRCGHQRPAPHRGEDSRQRTPKSVVMDADGKQLFVVDYARSVLLVDTRDYTAQTPWGGCTSAVVVSPDGRHLYVAHNRSSMVGPTAWSS